MRARNYSPARRLRMRRFGMVSRLTASYSSLQLGRQSSHVAINQLRSPPGSERNESVMIWGRGVHAKRHESGMGACCFCCVLIVATNIDPCRLTVATVEGEVASLVLSFFVLQGATVGSSRTHRAVLPRTLLSDHITCEIVVTPAISAVPCLGAFRSRGSLLRSEFRCRAAKSSWPKLTQR